MLKENGKQKPEKKLKTIKCKTCGCKFSNTEDNTEKVSNKIMYVCPECGEVVKK